MEWSGEEDTAPAPYLQTFYARTRRVNRALGGAFYNQWARVRASGKLFVDNGWMLDTLHWNEAGHAFTAQPLIDFVAKGIRV
jgi:hypothetical protein